MAAGHPFRNLFLTIFNYASLGVASASAGISFFEQIFFTVSGVGQKLNLESLLLKIPEPLLHPACSMAALGPDPLPDKKKPPEELAAAWLPAASAVPAGGPASAVGFTEVAGCSSAWFVWFGGVAAAPPAFSFMS
jgi:hypothetical protein